MKDGYFVRGVALAFSVLVAAPAYAAPEGGAEGGSSTIPDGAVSCTSSATCGAPTPYCSSTLHTCVECTTDRNCPMGLACDAARGVCRTCVTDADCSPARPYCDPSTRSCIECVTDTNCGPEGETCSGGKCGSCGDGICGRHEVLLDEGRGTDDDGVACPKDCAALCPGHDLKSRLGKGLLTGTFADERPIFGAFCVPSDGPDVVATWTPPRTGSFFVKVAGGSVVSVTT